MKPETVFSTARATGTFNLGRAWVALCLMLALHVADEALNDFLSFYNPAVSAIREKVPFLILPTFSFDLWLAGLIVAVVALLFLSIFAFRGAKWMKPLSYVLGIIMVFNALIHIIASIYMNSLMPGVYSSPFLLACSIYLLMAAGQVGKKTAPADIPNTS